MCYPKTKRLRGRVGLAAKPVGAGGLCEDQVSRSETKGVQFLRPVLFRPRPWERHYYAFVHDSISSFFLPAGPRSSTGRDGRFIVCRVLKQNRTDQRMGATVAPYNGQEMIDGHWKLEAVQFQ